MKKIVLLLVLFLAFCFCVSCNGDVDQPVEETAGETEAVTKTEPEADPPKGPKVTVREGDYHKVVIFDLPDEPFRDAVVSHMRKQASIEWVCGADFGIYEDFNSWGINLTFKRGQKYTGIPYADTKVSYIQFEEALENGKYTSTSTAWKDVFGVQCVSSIMNSVQQFDPKTCGTSYNLTPGLSDFKGVVVGGYTVPQGLKQTKQIIEATDPNVMTEAYAQMKKGDIIVKQDLLNGSSHLRVVAEDPVVVRNAVGKVNLSRSYITCIEQTNSFDKTRTDVKTTWYVDHKYTFDELRTTNYVPITLEIYSKDITECEVPYIYLDNKITEAHVQKGTLVSTVKSNFPLRYVYLDLYNKDGQLVRRQMAYDMAKQYSVSLRKFYTVLMDGIESGDYTLVVTGGIARGSAELARVDYTYTK